MSSASALEAVLRCAATVEVAESLDQVRDDVRRFCAGLGYDRFMLFSTSAGQSEPVERIYWLEGDWFGTGEAVDAKTYMRWKTTLGVSANGLKSRPRPRRYASLYVMVKSVPDTARSQSQLLEPESPPLSLELPPSPDECVLWSDP